MLMVIMHLPRVAQLRAASQWRTVATVQRWLMSDVYFIQYTCGGRPVHTGR